MTAKKNVAVIEDTSAAVDLYNDLLADQSLVENYRPDDLLMPFLKQLQANSPEVKKGNPKQIQGAAEGMFLNTVTGELFDGDEGVLIVPVAFSWSVVEWLDREKGQTGMVKDYGPDEAILHSPNVTQDERGRYVTAKTPRTFLVPTHYQLIYVLNQTGGSTQFDPVMFPMSNSSLKESKRWNNLKTKLTHAGQRLPSFAGVYRLSSETKTSKTSGQMYQSPKIEFVGKLPEVVKNAQDAKSIFTSAVDLFKATQAGKVRVNHEDAADETDANGENMPF